MKTQISKLLFIAAMLMQSAAFAQTYCSPTFSANDVGDHFISNVTLGSINNSSAKSSGGYGNYTSLAPPCLAKDGGYYFFTVTTYHLASVLYGQRVRVYVDFNKDGIWGTDETVMSGSTCVSTCSGYTTINGSFYVPATATNGLTRMRVISSSDPSITNGCGPFNYGEVEDYTVNIVSSINLTSGLVAYYPFNGNATDESVNSNNGTVNGATLTTNRFGTANSAYSFDGTNDYISIPDHATLDVSTITISAWIYPVSTPSIYSGIINKRTSTDLNAFSTTASTSSLRLSARFTDGSFNEPSVPNIITLNQWQHIIYTVCNGTVSIYRNGVLVLNSATSAGKSLSSSTAPLEIGRTIWFPANVPTYNYWNGKIDEVRIYNRCLSPCEIAANYTAAARQSEELEETSYSESSNITIYPNPSNLGYIEIEGNTAENSRYEIFDLTGKKVLAGSMGSKIDITSISEGTYLIQIKDDQGTIIKTDRIIKY